MIPLLLSLALAGDPLTQMKPIDPKAPLTLGIGRPNGMELAKRAQATLEPWLTKELKHPVKVEILADYDALAAALAGGSVDLAWITPVAFVQASEKNHDVTAVAKAMRGGALFYRAAFIVKKDAPQKTLEELKGKSVGYVSKSSSSGYIFPRALLASRGFDPGGFFASEKLFGDHPAVCKAVRAGEVEVGATFTDEPKAGEAPKADGCADAPPLGDFRVVAASGPIPNDVIAARADFDERLVGPVLSAFGNMGKSEEGQMLLQSVFHADGWGVAVDGDFTTVADALAAQKPRAQARPKGSKRARPAGTKKVKKPKR